MRIDTQFFIGDLVAVNKNNMFNEFPEQYIPFLHEIFGSIDEDEDIFFKGKIVGLHIGTELSYIVQVTLDDGETYDDNLDAIMEKLEEEGHTKMAETLETEFESMPSRFCLLLSAMSLTHLEEDDEDESDEDEKEEE